MDWIWIFLGIILIVVGIIGSLLPLLPGPPIAYAGLLIQQLRTDMPYSTSFMLVWLVVVAAVLVMDYFIPVWGTKKFGGTKYGVWGCMLGLIAAFWLGPLGVIIGPFIGAFIGELLAQQHSGNALKAAIGSFVGFLLGSLLKITVCFVMFWYVIASI